MSIRLRLILSYLVMIFVPVLFVFVSALLVALLFRGDINELKSIYLPPEHIKQISNRDQMFINIHRATLKNPGEFNKSSYLKQVDQELNKYGTKLLVRKDKKIIYQSSSLNGLDPDDLPLFGLFGEIDPIEQIHHKVVSIKKLDFFYPDDSEGSLFFVTDGSSLAKFVRSSYPILFVSLILTLIVTNGLLTYFVSKSIIRPIRELQKAAREMKDGNLDFSIKPSSKDELGQLAQSFEEMRIRLKGSIEKQLAYEENRKELIANISHDLKTPITTIKGYVEGIRDGVANSPEKVDKYIQTIYTKSMDLDHMIDELFLYSKLDLQRLPFHFEQFAFNGYLQDFIEELRFDLEEKNIIITFFEEKNNNYLIEGDREHLKRVINNIVENSLKYNDKQVRELRFQLSSIGSDILFSMADNGPGIAEENLSLIFDRFYRVDLSRSTEKTGSGLGLSIAKRIIEEHHGSIWAESKLGEGTTILFTLKRAGEDVHEKYPNH
jgi:histidine kinase